MSQQNQQNHGSPVALRCPPPQRPTPFPVSCSAPCPPYAGHCGSGSQRPRDQRLAGSSRALWKPRCLSGGTTHHIKEKECWGVSDRPTLVSCTHSAGSTVSSLVLGLLAPLHLGGKNSAKLYFGFCLPPTPSAQHQHRCSGVVAAVNTWGFCSDMRTPLLVQAASLAFHLRETGGLRLLSEFSASSLPLSCVIPQS